MRMNIVLFIFSVGIFEDPATHVFGSVGLVVRCRDLRALRVLYIYGELINLWRNKFGNKLW
jgi:hypothetical protein